MAQVASAIDGLDFEAVILAFTDGAASLLGNIGTVILYVAFLLVEQQFMPIKLNAIAGTEEKGVEIRRVMDDISRRIRTYLFTKSLTSAAMAGVVWIFLTFAGVDFAGFWALLVFILNFIPVVGGIVSGVFPAVLALVQFPTFGPFMIVVAGVATAHLIIGNVVEPRFVGSSVNLSPLVVILALAIWGLIWGIPGMFSVHTADSHRDDHLCRVQTNAAHCYCVVGKRQFRPHSVTLRQVAIHTNTGIVPDFASTDDLDSIYLQHSHDAKRYTPRIC